MLINMKVVFVALVLCHLAVTNSKASIAHGRSKNEADDTLGLGINNTAEPNHHEHSESGSRRAIVKSTDGCYTKFFVKNQPPTGFEPDPQYPDSIKHICQSSHGDTLYATMFDERIGIAVYAAYLVEYTQIPFMGAFSFEATWIQNEGITRQGSSQMFTNNGQNIDRGHLVPAGTYSFDCIARLSTFRYTNAVPQHHDFNHIQWNQYEEKVRKFASDVCYPNTGDLYLLTGTSEAIVTEKFFGRHNLKYFTPAENQNTETKIVIPNSMWTAGCCVNQDGVVGGFAAIGNNVQVNPEVHQESVKQLEIILATGRGGGTIELFPGNADCSENVKQYRYRKIGLYSSWTKS